jgi:hypothetical protein
MTRALEAPRAARRGPPNHIRAAHRSVRSLTPSNASVIGPLPAGGKNPATIRLGRGPVGNGSRNHPAALSKTGILKPCSKSSRKRRGSAGLISPVR